jgi:putative ABC transport system substrate-binding protein
MASYIARRKFLATLLGGAAAAWPLAARAQQPGKRHTIGYLTASGPLNLVDAVTAFNDALRELGWVDYFDLEPQCCSRNRFS